MNTTLIHKLASDIRFAFLSGDNSKSIDLLFSAALRQIGCSKIRLNLFFLELKNSELQSMLLNKLNITRDDLRD